MCSVTLQIASKFPFYFLSYLLFSSSSANFAYFYLVAFCLLEVIFFRPSDFHPNSYIMSHSAALPPPLSPPRPAVAFPRLLLNIPCAPPSFPSPLLTSLHSYQSSVTYMISMTWQCPTFVTSLILPSLTCPAGNKCSLLSLLLPMLQ